MIETEELPFISTDRDTKKSFEFNGDIFKLRLKKNDEKEFFTMDVFDEDDNIVFTGKLNYKSQFVDSILPDLPFQLVPFDIAELGNENFENVITDENLGVAIKIYSNIEEADDT